MACDDLNSGLAASDRPAGDLSLSRPASGNFCRSYDFTPAPSGPGLLTFANDDIVTFAGASITSF